jgi:Carbohydrate family 9 binding domain-like
MIKELLGSAALTAAVLAMTAPVSAQVIYDFEDYADTAALKAVWGAGTSTTIELSAENSPSTAGSKSLQLNASYPAVVSSTAGANGPVFASPMDLTDKQIAISVKADGAVPASGYTGLFFVYLYEDGAEGTNFGRIQYDASVFATGWTDLAVNTSSIEKPWNAAAFPDLTNISKIDILVYGQPGSGTPAAYDAVFLVDDITIQDSPAPPAPPETYTIVETTTAPTIDGVIGSDWDTANTIDSFNVIATTTPAAEAITVKALWDATNLYILWTMANADVGRTSAPTANDEYPSGDKQNIVLFASGHNASEYYRIVLTPDPTSATFYCTTNALNSTYLSSGDMATWDPAIVGGTTYTGGVLTTEIAIPLSSFNVHGTEIDAENGALWGCQLGDSNSGEYSSWGEATADNFIGITPKNGWQFGDVNAVNDWNLYN